MKHNSFLQPGGFGDFRDIALQSLSCFYVVTIFHIKRNESVNHSLN